MKSLIRIFLLSMTLESSQASDSELYEEMSCYAILYGLRSIELEKDDRRQEIIIANLSNLMFRYWYESRIVNQVSSATLDATLVHVLCGTRELGKYKKLFKSEFIEKHVKAPLSNLSKGSLQIYLKQYQLFLETELKKNANKSERGQ